MIPKIIHWCWLNDDPYPKDIEDCMKSWKILQDYSIKKWDFKCEEIMEVPFVKYLCNNKLYGFASDYVRFWACYTYGGIYIDADIEVLKTFDDLLDRDYILSELNGHINAAVVGCAKGHPIFKKLMDHFYNITPKEWKGYSVQKVLFELCKEYAPDFLPYNWFDPCIGPELYDITLDTYTIHHAQFSWQTPLMEYLQSHNK